MMDNQSDRHNIPSYALEKGPAPGARETRMRPPRTGNPLRARGGEGDA